MKTLLVLRHAKSDWRKPGMADHERPLNSRGKRDAPRMGKLLSSIGVIPDWIACSTANRAIKTAEKVAKQFRRKPVLDSTADFYLAPPNQYVQYLNSMPGDPMCVMVVGHNPGVEELVASLTGSFERMPTAALAQIELPIESWSELRLDTRGQLVNLWRPKQLEDDSSIA